MSNRPQKAGEYKAELDPPLHWDRKLSMSKSLSIEKSNVHNSSIFIYELKRVYREDEAQIIA